MKGWLGANLFFIAMACIAAGLFFGGYELVRALHFSATTERVLGGLVAIAALVLTGVIGKKLLRVLERARAR